MSFIFEPPFRQRVWKDVRRKQVDLEDTEDRNSSEDESNDLSDEFPRHESQRNRAYKTASSQSVHQPFRHQNLKFQHFTSLNAALYKCLHEHNFEQASRIFGMLLRFEPPDISPAQTHVDIRRQNLWGVGAEILLRRNAPSAGEDEDDQFHVFSMQRHHRISTEKGFEEAKAFFERLILQYPKKKSQASSSASKYANHGYRADPLADDTVTSLELYPNFFGVWIFQIQSRVQERASKFAELLKHHQYPQPDVQDETDCLCDSNAADIRPIIDRMDDVVKGPPYDQDVQLLRMQADLRLWMADVLRPSSSRCDESQRWRTEALEVIQRIKHVADR